MVENRFRLSQIGIKAGVIIDQYDTLSINDSATSRMLCIDHGPRFMWIGDQPWSPREPNESDGQLADGILRSDRGRVDGVPREARVGPHKMRDELQCFGPQGVFQERFSEGHTVLNQLLLDLM